MTRATSEVAACADSGVTREGVVARTADLTMRFGAVTALEDLDVAIGPGVTGLVGANGAGKSTLIKILLGLLRPTAGSAQVLGLDIATQGEQIRRLVGYMPEHDCLPPDVSASDFVVHLGTMSGLPPTVARERAADILRHVGLAEERYRPMGGYSTGMKQRAKLAQSLVHDPRLVFLDEPTNGLDPAAREDMLRLVRRIGHDFGISVLVTSHLLGELERVSDHVIVLDGGRLLRSSATGDFLSGTGELLVEVLGAAAERDEMVAGLAAAGVRAAAEGRLIRVAPIAPGASSAGETAAGDPVDPREARFVYDTIRDTAERLGVGLMRLQSDRHRLEDVFADPSDASDDLTEAS